ncbi:MAG: hypothetical protein GWP08_03000 [Nitrospiraceae bacterium]|nr:hypothetical protein [Nitrospiraceae bacterium]
MSPGSEDKVAVIEARELFHLPQLVSQRLRDSARAHGAEDHHVVKYLWLRLDEQCRAATIDGECRSMDAEEWLNVVDEAASVGVECMVVYVGGVLSACPHLWTVSQWAQDVHGMTVGFHTSRKNLTEEEAGVLLQLDPALTWLFVEPEALANLSRLQEQGINVCCAEVDRKDATAACEGPKNLVCVGPNGLLYSCGSVLGVEGFRLGHVAEKPLGELLGDGGPDRAIADGTVRNELGCNGCPNEMAVRMAR